MPRHRVSSRRNPDDFAGVDLRTDNPYQIRFDGDQVTYTIDDIHVYSLGEGRIATQEDEMPNSNQTATLQDYLRNCTFHEEVERGLDLNPLESKFLTPTNPDYMVVIPKVFSFFQAAAEGRYTDRTMMQVNRAVNDIMRMEAVDDTAPIQRIITVYAPYHVDLDTEVKRGGTIAMGIEFRGKAMIAVTPSARRYGIGTFILRHLGVSVWVGRQNYDAIQFLAHNAWFPTAMNSSGAIRFDYRECND